MGNIPNISGAAGEYLCGTELLRPVAGRGFLFDPFLLGGKAPTFDYMVHLLDTNGNRTGAFFFLQVKTTQKQPGLSGTYSVMFSAADVKRASAQKIPFFLCVVDRAVTRSEKIFIMGVDSMRKKGISRIAPIYDLADDAVKIALFDEVTRLWKSQPVPALTKFI
jgi:hypothetical protein